MIFAVAEDNLSIKLTPEFVKELREIIQKERELNQKASEFHQDMCRDHEKNLEKLDKLEIALNAAILEQKMS